MNYEFIETQRRMRSCALEVEDVDDYDIPCTYIAGFINICAEPI